MCQAEIYVTPPRSGEIEEINFYPQSNDLVWVKFIDSNSNEWCGKFAEGIKSFSTVGVLREGIGFVLARGRSYFVEINQKLILSVVEDEDFEDAVCLVEKDLVLVTDGLHLALYSKDDLVWSSERFSVDGVKFTSSDGNEVCGKFNDLSVDWQDFTFLVDERKIIRDWILKDNFGFG